VQCGAVLAVLPLFSERLSMLSRWREPASREFLTKIAIAFFITGVGGLVLDKLHFKLPEKVAPVAVALVVGGVAFIAVEQWLRGRPRLEGITWTIAVAVAIAQLVAAVFPGASRSGATIVFALILGATRIAATEFSFLVGIPTLLAAGGLKIFKAVRHPLADAAPENWTLLALATIVAAIVSFIAVKWLLRFVATHTFVGFGIYRIVLGIVLLFAAWRL
jgi:undecaprenyl-diphosphatase